MDVENPIRENFEQRALHEAQESSEADDSDASGFEACGGFLLRFFREFRLKSTAVDHPGFDPALAGALEDEGGRIVGKHESDSSIKHPSIDRIKDRLHV